MKIAFLGSSSQIAKGLLRVFNYVSSDIYMSSRFLITSWEHRVFLTSKMLGINPFDQYAVNAGKMAAQKKLKKLRDDSKNQKK